MKLALVEVRLYEARGLEDYFTRLQPRIAENIERARAVAAEASTAASNAEIESKRQQYATERSTGEYWFEASLSLLKVVRLEAKQAAELSDMANALVRVHQSAAPYFADLPNPLAMTKTDVDGNFSFKLPEFRKGLAVAATTERAVGVGQEVYFWVLRLPDEHETKIALNNDNECSTDASASLLRTVALDSDSTKAIGGSVEDIQSGLNRLRELEAKISGVPSAQPSIPTSAATPQSPEFVVLTDDFAVDAPDGHEIKIPFRTKLQVVAHHSRDLAVLYEGRQYTIPDAITEPAK